MHNSSPPRTSKRTPSFGTTFTAAAASDLMDLALDSLVCLLASLTASDETWRASQSSKGGPKLGFTLKGKEGLLEIRDILESFLQTFFRYKLNSLGMFISSHSLRTLQEIKSLHLNCYNISQFLPISSHC